MQEGQEDRDPAHGDPSLTGRLTKVSIYDQGFPEGQDRARGMMTRCVYIHLLCCLP